MSVEELMAVVAPPAHPRDVGDLAAWAAVEERLGTRLPADFRDFVFRYGTGIFNDPARLCIFPRNPLAPDFDAKFRDDCDHRLETGVIQRHELADVYRRRPLRLRDEQPKQRLGSADIPRKQHGGIMIAFGCS